MAKKTPLLTEDAPVSLISLDPATATRSIATVVSEQNDEKDYLEEKVTIQFFNLQDPGRSQFFATGDVQKPDGFEIEDKEIKTITRAMLRFIESRQTPVYEFKPVGHYANGLPKMKKMLVGWQPKFQCREVHERELKRKNIA